MHAPLWNIVTPQTVSLFSKTSCRQVVEMNSKKPNHIVQRFDSRWSRLLLSIGICRTVCWPLRSSPSAWEFLLTAESWRILVPANRFPPNIKQEQHRKWSLCSCWLLMYQCLSSCRSSPSVLEAGVQSRHHDIYQDNHDVTKPYYQTSNFHIRKFTIWM